MKDITAIFHHCHKVRIDDGKIMPIRFTEKKLGDYSVKPRTPYYLCPAGVTLEFFTEKEKIKFDFELRPAQYEYITSDVFDVYEDDIFMATVEPTTYVGTFAYRKQQKGRTKIRIHLPVGVSVYISNFDLGEYEIVPSFEKKVMVYGDSISQGLFGKNPSLGYLPKMAYKNNFDYLNASVGGDIYSAEDIDREVNYDPDLIFIERGVNDLVFVKDHDQILQNAEKMFAKLKQLYSGVPVLVMSGMWTTSFGEDGQSDSFLTLERTKALTHGIQALCEKFQFEFVDGLEIIPHDEDYFADICHPNNKGFNEMAVRLEPYFKKMLNL